ncbi:hypothetical protein BDN70DRAFT_870098 [Pholiota conissans]|uniref:Large ribosomal subunit protein mL40 n=1 Tax=Pholiota conissans TaxID=109636 RepID=A0A9P5ZFK3_9AGAR|nr:hypothetical protein BDN70DRAFT_870098 [Pholiota conissans]
MSLPTSLLRSSGSVSRRALPTRTTLGAVRTYAIPNQDSTAGDPKKDIIRRVLYPGNIKNKSTPIGTWRPDVGRAIQRAIPSAQAHETIERAWLLHRRHLRQQRAAETERKFLKMKEAMDVLYEVDPRLYMEANKKDDPRARSQEEMEVMKKAKTSEVRAMEARIRGLFPRELRIPTDTPSRTGWKYEWKAFHRPL